MLPGTAAYVYAGSTVPSLQTLADDGAGSVLNWQMLLAFAILGILPLAIQKIVSLLKSFRYDCDEQKLVGNAVSEAQGVPPDKASDVLAS